MSAAHFPSARLCFVLLFHCRELERQDLLISSAPLNLAISKIISHRYLLAFAFLPCKRAKYLFTQSAVENVTTRQNRQHEDVVQYVCFSTQASFPEARLETGSLHPHLVFSRRSDSYARFFLQHTIPMLDSLLPTLLATRSAMLSHHHPETHHSEPLFKVNTCP